MAGRRRNAVEICRQVLRTANASFPCFGGPQTHLIELVDSEQLRYTTDLPTGRARRIRQLLHFS
jgi:hypothetical protein